MKGNDNKKMIAVDLDGTLLSTKKTISEENKAALRQALKAGFYLFFATGRPYKFARAYADAISSDISIIANNGAYNVYKDYKEELPFPEADLRTIVEKARSLNLELHFEAFSSLYSLAAERRRGLFPDMFGITTRFLDKEKILETIKDDPIYTIVVNEDNNRDDHKEFTRRVAALNRFEMASYAPKSYDITMAAATKGIAVGKMARILDIEAKNITAIGDSENDLSMFRVAGTAIAMANAAEPVRRAAAFVTRGNDEHGVAYALEKILMKQ
jgi:Cof subfamily protein (haloacid dehalogenase superfamily)